MRVARAVLGALVCAVLLPASAGTRHAAGEAAVEERPLLDNERVLVVEFVFPPGFRGEEHSAVADEFAYVLDGQFTVVTRGRGRRVVKRGEVEYASKGTIHQSLNEAREPARVVVVLLKGR